MSSGKRNKTRSPTRTNYFYNQQKLAVKPESIESKLGKIPLEQDADFLKAIKVELIGLQRRIRHETLQKLELVKKMKELESKHRESRFETSSRAIETATIAIQCDLVPPETSEETSPAAMITLGGD